MWGRVGGSVTRARPRHPLHRMPFDSPGEARRRFAYPGRKKDCLSSLFNLVPGGGIGHTGATPASAASDALRFPRRSAQALRLPRTKKRLPEQSFQFGAGGGIGHTGATPASAASDALRFPRRSAQALRLPRTKKRLPEQSFQFGAGGGIGHTGATPASAASDALRFPRRSAQALRLPRTKKRLPEQSFQFGAGGGNRTPTPFQAPDFESGTSTSSITPARRGALSMKHLPISTTIVPL